MVEIKIDKYWQAVSAIVLTLSTFFGAAAWATSMYLQLRDTRKAQEKQVEVVSEAVKKLTASIDNLAKALTDHEKRLSIHDMQIRALERQGR